MHTPALSLNDAAKLVEGQDLRPLADLLAPAVAAMREATEEERSIRHELSLIKEELQLISETALRSALNDL